MYELLAELTSLLERTSQFTDRGCARLHDGLQEVVDKYTGTPATYQYRNHPSWDTAWMDLDRSQVGIVLDLGHAVERSLVAGDWEAVTGVPV
ncbi:hypothetical protein IV500_04935 [Paeniglutamicibacter antarcticus]|uniref:Uncharacterized protein n=1 Tax=Arthrobacter terrae TaxID=2935737 RepID=A0A931G4G2_9MICC|nr:hypothetical protein [Arthrobacter terrae]MBG0738763.1 hypothetical protein [Arthrobacter terrae]